MSVFFDMNLVSFLIKNEVARANCGDDSPPLIHVALTYTLVSLRYAYCTEAHLQSDSRCAALIMRARARESRSSRIQRPSGGETDTAEYRRIIVNSIQSLCGCAPCLPSSWQILEQPDRRYPVYDTRQVDYLAHDERY